MRGDRSAVSFGDHLGDRQADARSTVGAVSGALNPVEPIEGVQRVLGGNPRAVIGHHDADHRTRAVSHQREPATRGTVPQRVVEQVGQVGQDLGDPICVRVNDGGRGDPRDPDVEVRPTRGVPVGGLSGRVGDDRQDVDERAPHRKASLLGGGDQGDVRAEARQGRDLVGEHRQRGVIGMGTHSASPVLSAMGLPSARGLSALRLTLGRWTTRADIISATGALARAVGVAVRALLGDAEPDPSPVGIGLAVTSLIVMPSLSWAQRRIGRALSSSAVVADSTQTLLCTYLSAVLLIGFVLNATLGWDSADPIAGLIIAAVAIKEGREAWRGESCSCVRPAHVGRSRRL